MYTSARRWTLFAGILSAAGMVMAAIPATPPAAPAAAPLISGWSVLKEGTAEGAVEIGAKNAANPNPNLIRIAITNFPEFGAGRMGVKNSLSLAVTAGKSYDITFNGTSEGIGVGLVFSLETDAGKVLCRTTLPEIGRGGGGGGRGARGGGGGGGAATTAPASAPAAANGYQTPAFRPYRTSVLARASAPVAHLTITAIEPVPVWIENLSIVERPASN